MIPEAEPRYSVLTWDMDLQEFTPQEGLSAPSQNITLWQLKRALRELQSMGYSCHRTHDDSDPSVLVERIEP